MVKDKDERQEKKNGEKGEVMRGKKGGKRQAWEEGKGKKKGK